MCLNTEFFLVRILLYSDQIQENTDRKKTLYLDTFHTVQYFHSITPEDIRKEKVSLCFQGNNMRAMGFINAFREINMRAMGFINAFRGYNMRAMGFVNELKANSKTIWKTCRSFQKQKNRALSLTPICWWYFIVFQTILIRSYNIPRNMWWFLETFGDFK